MKKLLIVNAYYYPGWRSGGPQQSIMNFVDTFGKKCDIYILTHNHDMGETEPYAEISYNTWIQVGNAKVYYSSSEHFTMKFLEKIMNKFDMVYLCEPYQEHSYKALILNKQKKINADVILASMGCFSAGALSHKQVKKKLFWNVFKMLWLSKNIKWSFTSEMERNEAAACIGYKHISNYYIAEDLPKRYVDLSNEKATHKVAGGLKIVFLSRICPKKNLSQAISIVSKLNGNIQFDIYGTKEDVTYWAQCETALMHLPSNVKWSYCGAVPAESVTPTFLKYDIFLFPTLGENFGHVIYEALTGGCIPLISNRTPWNNLEENDCGCAVPLEDENQYVDCVQQYVDMSGEQLRIKEISAMEYAKQKYDNSVNCSGYYSMIC